MRSTNTLPEGYSKYYSLDLQKEKGKMLLVNGLSALIAVAMTIPVLLFVPVSALWSSGYAGMSSKFLAIAALMVAYIILHELVHGVAMKICGTKKVKYGFTGMYAFAGSDDYYGKGAYIFIALAPVILWGIVLAVACALVPTEWFWVVYLVQILNVSGASGDLFVTLKFIRFPADILVKDHGVSMEVYSKAEAKTE